jgi:hypothetical protein
MRFTWIAVVFVMALSAAALADDAKPVRINSWKADVIDLYDQPKGKVVEQKPAAELPPGEAKRVGLGWLEVQVGGKSYYVESTQARTDLKLGGKPKCDRLDGATGYAASRGLGEEGCEP